MMQRGCSPVVVVVSKLSLSGWTQRCNSLSVRVIEIMVLTYLSKISMSTKLITSAAVVQRLFFDDAIVLFAAPSFL